jgi:hypothetical protein
LESAAASLDAEKISKNILENAFFFFALFCKNRFLL